jgi:glycosyltransferase involved in cell wall biosynthesis
MNIWIVMPAYNEEGSIGKVLEGLKREGYEQIIVVDDGSTDRTAKIAGSKGAVVLKHERNRGLGAALRTGLQEALNRGADRAVTFDADGQHDPRAIRELLKALNGADLAIGVRAKGKMPLHKRVGNFGLNFITHMLGGTFTDSQSGFRAFNRRALQTIQIRSDRYEVSSEIIIQARQKSLRVRGVPIEAIFTDYSKARGTTIASGFRIFWRLLKQKARFPSKLAGGTK